jgi:hypothetical protein
VRTVAIAAAALVVTTVGCDDADRPSQQVESTVEGTATADAGADATASEPPFDVYVVEARLVGAAALAVHAEPAGTLVDGERLHALLGLTSLGSDVAVDGLPWFAAEVAADDGVGVLGVSGICGFGWELDGTRTTADPCSAAEPVAIVPAGRTVHLPLVLAPRTPAGPPAAGRYVVEIPLRRDDPEASSIVVTYEVTPRDAARLPVLDDAVVPLHIELEPYSAPPAVLDGDAPITVVVEDPYRRELARGQVVPTGSGSASVELSAPAGVVHVVSLLPGPGGELARCGSQPLVVGDGPTSLTLLVAAGTDGTCGDG